MNTEADSNYVSPVELARRIIYIYKRFPDNLVKIPIYFWGPSKAFGEPRNSDGYFPTNLDILSIILEKNNIYHEVQRWDDSYASDYNSWYLILNHGHPEETTIEWESAILFKTFSVISEEDRSGRYGRYPFRRIPDEYVRKHILNNEPSFQIQLFDELYQGNYHYELYYSRSGVW